jgi:hypothetical protein
LSQPFGGLAEKLILQFVSAIGIEPRCRSAAPIRLECCSVV